MRKAHCQGMNSFSAFVLTSEVFLKELFHALQKTHGTIKPVKLQKTKHTKNGLNQLSGLIMGVKIEISSFFFFFFFFLSFVFLGLHLQHMKVPRLGVKSKLQLPAYATATATLI